ncbi:MAG: hypothetical protein ACOYXM_17695 [Actinomycetota bacterium]
MSGNADNDDLDVLAGGAKRTGRSVRGIAQWAHNTGCGTNNAAFAARVDLDQLLKGTPLEAEYGQSRFAIARGQRVERIGRDNNYEKTFEVLDEAFGYPDDGRIALDMRRGHGFGNDALDARAEATKVAVAKIVAGAKDAPNIIDGAVLKADIGGYQARLEADTLGARTGPEFHVAEFKSWAKVDGQFADAGKVGDALRQMGLYSLLVAQLIEEVGGDPDLILSDVGLLVTPRNVGLHLVGSKLSLGRARTVAETTLAALPDPAALVGHVDPDATFGAIADLAAADDDRLEALERVTDVYGIEYRQSCLSSCGLAHFCRHKAREVGAPDLCGSNVVRMLPGVSSLQRAHALADGVTPTDEERATGVAEVLLDTNSLYKTAIAQHEGTGP